MAGVLEGVEPLYPQDELFVGDLPILVGVPGVEENSYQSVVLLLPQLKKLLVINEAVLIFVNHFKDLVIFLQLVSAEDRLSDPFELTVAHIKNIINGERLDFYANQKV